MTTVKEAAAELKSAAWAKFKQEQRADRRGIGQVPPSRTDALAAQHGRAESRKARRKAHQARRTQRRSPEHHAVRVASKRAAHA